MKLINEQRYEKVKQLFDEYDIQFPADENRNELIKTYTNVFEIISYFINNKLSNKELLTAFDTLSDLITNNKQKFAFIVDNEDRIRAQVRYMEEIPETAGKLTMEEKIGFAFCVYTAVCVQIYDEERDMMCNGITLFDSIENIKNEFEYEKQNRPEFFSVETIKLPSADYGYSKKNPIAVTSIHMGYVYLNHLLYNNQPIGYKRTGIIYPKTGKGIIDIYNIFEVKKGWLFKRKTFIAKLYIYPYCRKTLKIPPKGFTLMNF